MTTPMFAIEPMTAMLISAGVSALIGGAGAIGAGAQRRRAARRERAARARRQVAEANRQDIPDFQQDLANPYANLQVATQAAEMQAEQQDIALASTLDTLRATGASAGGATALARAAAQSKRGVAASIEQQEARNAQLRAQGEMQAAQMRQRGQAMAFQAQEAREMTELDRQASLESSYNQQAAAYGAQSSAMAGQAVGSLVTGGLEAYAGGMFKKDTSARPITKAELKDLPPMEEPFSEDEMWDSFDEYDKMMEEMEQEELYENWPTRMGGTSGRNVEDYYKGWKPFAGMSVAEGRRAARRAKYYND